MSILTEKTNLKEVINNLEFSVILKSKIHGFGLFANVDIDEGVTLGYLDGQLISWSLHEKHELTLEWNAIENDRILVRPYRTKYSFINHSRKPNLYLEYNPLRVVTLNKINKNIEMLLDYRKEKLNQKYLNSEKGSYL